MSVWTSLAAAPFRRRRDTLRRHFARAQDRLAVRLAHAYRHQTAGLALGLDRVRDARSLSRAVGLRSYEEHLPWFGRPKYWAVTTGTTGGEKRIPVSFELLRQNQSAFLLFLACCIDALGDLSVLRGTFLGLGSCTPVVLGPDGIPLGSMTSIAARERPAYAQRWLAPGNDLDHLPSWTEKMEKLVDTMKARDVRIVGGMPPWLLSLAEHARARLGIEHLGQLWPKLRLTITGGTFFDPYAARLRAAFGPLTFRSIYTATEGFFGIQDGPEPGYLPVSDTTFFEFVPLEELGKNPQKRLLHEVEAGVEYALVCSTFAGLFGYVVGDTVRFVSLDPPRFVVSGRVRQRANVAGEKVTLEQIEGAALEATRAHGWDLGEFCLVQVPPSASDAPYHLWVVELGPDVDRRALAGALDEALSARSATYRVRREGKTPALGPPRVLVARRGAFTRWLARDGKIGGHHKVPRLPPNLPPDFDLLDPSPRQVTT